MIPKNAIVRIAAFDKPSDIRWRVLGYEPETDSYQLETTVTGHKSTIERVLFHAWLRRKQLIREKPTA
jgi:hypothetical protein